VTLSIATCQPPAPMPGRPWPHRRHRSDRACFPAGRPVEPDPPALERLSPVSAEKNAVNDLGASNDPCGNIYLYVVIVPTKSAKPLRSNGVSLGLYSSINSSAASVCGVAGLGNNSLSCGTTSPWLGESTGSWSSPEVSSWPESAGGSVSAPESSAGGVGSQLSAGKPTAAWDGPVLLPLATFPDAGVGAVLTAKSAASAFVSRYAWVTVPTNRWRLLPAGMPVVLAVTNTWQPSREGVAAILFFGALHLVHDCRRGSATAACPDLIRTVQKPNVPAGGRKPSAEPCTGHIRQILHRLSAARKLTSHYI
jgi:hypothetical protein